jgi:membrane-associated phospholipid phosphatase
VKRAAIVLAALALALLIGFSLHDHVLLPGDAAAFDVMRTLRFQTGVDVVRVLTDIGSLPPTLLTVVLTAVYLDRRQGRRRRALQLVAGYALVYVLVHVAKVAWARPRPDHRLQQVVGLSYPSGHAAYSAAYVACAVALRSRRLLIAAIGLSVAIGLSRLYLHVHFLTDVVGGYALALAVYAAVLRP